MIIGDIGDDGEDDDGGEESETRRRLVLQFERDFETGT